MSQPASKEIEDTLLIENLPYDIDGGIAQRASIGLIVLSTDYTIEHEWRQAFAAFDGVALYQSRIHNENMITPDAAAAAALTASATISSMPTGIQVSADHDDFLRR